jgi:hypothetical protein
MIRYGYQRQLQPPAPFVKVLLRNPASGVELRDLPAQIDTAADRTVLPDATVKALGLPQVGIMSFAAFGGVTFSLPVYAVLLGLHDLPAQPVKVAAHANEPWLLLGRDVLNSNRVLLDGPQLVLEIGS